MLSVAGILVASPVSMLKRAPWRGQIISLPSIFPPHGQLDSGLGAAWSDAVRGRSVAVSATVRPWSAHVKAVSFRPPIWPTCHPTARCNIRLVVLHAATSVSPPRNGRSRVVLSRIGEGMVLAIQGLVRSRRKKSGPFATVGPAGGPAPATRESGPPRPPGGVVFCRITPRWWSYAEPYNHWLERFYRLTYATPRES